MSDDRLFLVVMPYDYQPEAGMVRPQSNSQLVKGWVALQFFVEQLEAKKVRWVIAKA